MESINNTCSREIQAGVINQCIVFHAIGSFGKKIALEVQQNTVDADYFIFRLDFSDSTWSYYKISNSSTFEIICTNKDITQILFYFDEYNSCVRGDGVITATISTGVYACCLLEDTIRAINENIYFVPYAQGLKNISLYRNQQRSKFLYVTDCLNITHEVPINSFQRYMETRYGELTIFPDASSIYIPIGYRVNIEMRNRIDVSSSNINRNSLNHVITDQYFPSYNGIASNADGTWPSVFASDYPFPKSYLSLYMNDLFKNADVINSDNPYTINDQLLFNFYNATNRWTSRCGILLCPSSKSSTDPSCLVHKENGSFYGYFPPWIIENYGESSYYCFERTDTYNPNATIRIANLDWNCEGVRNAYMTCIRKFSAALKNYEVPNSDGKKLYDYIEYIKVGFIGTWGEGIRLNLPDDVAPPAANYLIAISDCICREFPDKIHYKSFASVLNSEFPQEYQEHILAGLKGPNTDNEGLFYDSACVARRTFVIGDDNDNSNTSEELLNRVFSSLSSSHCLMEASQYLSNDRVPSYSSLEEYVKYMRPDFFVLDNINFSHNMSGNVMIKETIKRIACYTGTRPYVLKNDTRISANDEVIVDITIGNYGTAKFADYWKLKIYIVEDDNTRREMDVSDFLLSEIPQPIEVGVPNVYDTKLLRRTYEVSFTHNIKVLMSVTDEQGINEKPLLFCNTEDFMPNDNGMYKLLDYSKEPF